MTTNPFFNNYASVSEQSLLEDLIIESIKMHGMDVQYLPKTLEDFDKIYGEDKLMTFNSALPVEMYVKNIDSFGGDGSFLSKFNIEIRDQMTLTVSVKRFKTAVGDPSNILRPNEGDLIWFPLNKKMFRVQYADEKAVFFQMGTLHTFDLTLETFEYSHERFNTGNPIIDALEQRYSDPTPGTPEDDAFDDSPEIQDEAEEFIDFSEADPWSSGVY